MGVYYRARTSIGVKVPYDKVFFEEKYETDNCSCLDKGSGRYCQHCSKEVKIITKTKSERYPYVTEDEDECTYRIGQYELKGPDWYYLGIQMDSIDIYEDGDSFQPIDAAGLCLLKQSLKDTLEPLNLWNEDEFGVYCWVEAT